MAWTSTKTQHMLVLLVTGHHQDQHMLCFGAYVEFFCLQSVTEAVSRHCTINGVHTINFVGF